MQSLVPLVLIALCALVLSVCVTFAALVYARRRGLLDQPGKRRSHAVPTPRGGGVGIVATLLLIGMPALWLLPDGWPPTTIIPVAAAVFAVAATGWLDDHHPMPVWPRIVVHVVAAILVAGAVLVPASHANGWMPWWLPVVAVVLVGGINAHNFMDGIDGILGQQGLFVMLGYALLAGLAGQMALAGAALAVASACFGFLLFNAPPARIFMGDVGSGALGLAVGAIAALLARRSPAMLWSVLILPSAFLVDSGLTLARRVWGGQRWYAPHRQHLYQWLVRVNWSHARVDAAYMTWNLVILAPLAALASRWPAQGVWYCIAAYVGGILAWHLARRACLASLRRRSGHEPA